MAKVSKELRRERLRILGIALLSVPSTREFDMRTWGTHWGGHKPPERNYCGTSACALGTAAMIPKFRRAGLKMEWDFTKEWNDEKNRDEKLWTATVYYKDHEGQAGGELFFGLTPDEAKGLFLDVARSKADTIAYISTLIDAT